MSQFSHIIGHENQANFFEKIAKNGEISHAFCFSGIEHLGKETLAREFAAVLFDCSAESLADTPDFIAVQEELDKKTGKRKNAISVDQIRILREKLSMSSFSGGWQVVLMRNADKMTIAAQNALLKTLEEPAQKTIIFLLARDESALLSTILSRTVHMRFNAVARESIEKALIEKGISKERACLVSGVAFGRPGVAFSLIEEKNEDLFFSSVDELLAWFALPLAKRMVQLGQRVKTSSKSELQAFLSNAQYLAHDILMTSLKLQEHSALSGKYQESLDSLAEKYGAKKMSVVLRALSQVRIDLNQNINPLLSLERFALSF